jgi:diaminopimelate decarboxylase
MCEPGRSICGDAGVLLSRVIFIKPGRTRNFVILDAAMNDLIRPAMYEAWHGIVPLRQPPEGAAEAEFDVVGPVCESSDTFAKGRLLPPLAAGDLVAFTGAGAYGAVMASTYNTRPLVPEVLVDKDRFAIVRKRPTFEEMVAGESLPPWFD